MAPTLNFDGIGSSSAKSAGYESLASSRLPNGFTLFYRLDDGLMTPRQVVAGLDPHPLYILYQ